MAPKPVLDVLKESIVDINDLTKKISKTSSTKRIGQRLPPHERRRTASFNTKRLPRKLRDIAAAEHSANGVQAPKNLTRKATRSPRHLLSKETRTNRESKRLETHIWHAKRFTMKSIFGFDLPAFPDQKSRRYQHRASKHLCTVCDLSYIQPIIIHDYKEAINRLQKITPPHTVPPLDAEYLSESRCQYLEIIDEDKIIGLVLAFRLRDALFILTHPSIYEEVSAYFSDLSTTFSDLSYTLFELSGNNALSIASKCLIPLDQYLQRNLSKNTKIWAQISSQSNSTNFLPTDFTTHLQIVDPRLIIPSHSPLSEDSLTNVDKTLEEFKMKNDSTNNSINSFFSLPFLETPKNAIEESESEFYEAQTPIDLEMPDFVDTFYHLESPKSFDRLVSARESDVAINARRGTYLKSSQIPVLDESTNPEIMILHPHEGSIWILAPHHWGMPLLNSFVNAGASAIGYDQRFEILADQGRFIFPALWPDSLAGKQLQIDAAINKIKAHFALPPNKRPAYESIGFSLYDALFCDISGEDSEDLRELKNLLEALCKKEAQHKQNRSIKKLHESEWLAGSQKTSLIEVDEVAINSIKVNQPSFKICRDIRNKTGLILPVMLSLYRGTCADNGFIYAANSTDSLNSEIEYENNQNRKIIGRVIFSNYSPRTGHGMALGLITRESVEEALPVNVLLRKPNCPTFRWAKTNFNKICFSY